MPYEEYPAGQLDVRGEKIPVTVDDAGRWFAKFNGSRHSGKTKDDLYAQLMQASRKAAVKVSVPFTYVDVKGRPFPGVATGIHQGTHNITVRWSGRNPNYGARQTDQVTYYADGSRGYFRPLTDAEVAELSSVRRAYEEAQANLRAWQKKYGLSLHQAINEQIEAEAEKMNKAEVS
jgi:hypothetical protein